ncbi:hypothetical protein JI58_09340 [Marinosulfonomonas sp. PRT-SC04]|nr:hypothetical protein JI58_09340 [Marinosulfonomonas sp. PRT-SC04]
MFTGETLDAAFNELDDIAPAGYAAGLKLRFSGPALVKGTYPAEWTAHYGDSLMAFWDPVVVWSLANTGHIRWSALKIPDPMGVMKQARAHGLKYGVVIALGKLSKRSLLGIARSDREFSDEEISRAVAVFTKIHDIVTESKFLTESQLEALRLIAGGDLYSEAANKLGISESALKARLKAARTRLNARSTVEAITRAKDHNLL